MNCLAHLALAHFSAALQTGNFLGDFVKGRAVRRLPPTVQVGVSFHRDIDRLTDADPRVRALNRLLRPRHGRYAGVITDIGFDHYLYRHWATFGPAPFPAFCAATYRNLAGYTDCMDDRVAGYVRGMVNDDWLQLYTTPAGMQRVFNRLRPRLSRPALLDGIETTLSDYDREFDATFRAFYPQLLELADRYRAPHHP